jgi:multidrug resistance protein, MATE family
MLSFVGERLVMSLLPDRRLSRQVISIAGPAIAGLSSQMVVSVVDTAMVGRLHNAEIALAAMGLGLLATWAIVSLFSSLATGTHVLVARRHGEGDKPGAGRVLSNSLILCGSIGLLFGALGFFFSYPIINFFSSDTAVAVTGAGYMKYRFLGLPFFLISVSYRGFFYGIGRTNIFMISAIIMNVLNIIFNYFLIFGNMGFPRMELAGAGLASTIGVVVSALFFMSVTFVKNYRIPYKYYNTVRFSAGIAGSIVRISLPISCQNIFILSGFLVFVAINGIVGTLEQAATQVVITALFISFMPLFGFGIAAQTLIGNHMGNRKMFLAENFGLETAKLGTIFTIMIGFVFIVFPQYILLIITTNDRVLEAAVPMLRIAGAAQVFYAVGIILANALQAAGAMVFVMLSEIITHWLIFLPLAYVLAVPLELGSIGAWLALPVYIIVYSLTMFIKFRSGGWKRIRI